MAEQISSAKAEARTVCITLRKARLVVDLARRKSVVEALAILRFAPRAVSSVAEKVLRSAIANAGHNCDFESANLCASEAYANEGATLKKSHPRAKGMAPPIDKRTSYVVAVAPKKSD